MERIFLNNNGKEYAIVEGEKGKRALLIHMHSNQCVVCEVLEENCWYHGNYFYNFDEAYKFFKEGR